MSKVGVKSAEEELTEFDAGSENLDLYKKRFVNLVTATLAAISLEDLTALADRDTKRVYMRWEEAGLEWEFSVVQMRQCFSIIYKLDGATHVYFAWSQGKVVTNTIPIHKVMSVYLARKRFWERMTNSFPSIKENLKPVFEAAKSNS